MGDYLPTVVVLNFHDDPPVTYIYSDGNLGKGSVYT
jgi:hypothetical protein